MQDALKLMEEMAKRGVLVIWRSQHDCLRIRCGKHLASGRGIGSVTRKVHAMVMKEVGK